MSVIIFEVGTLSFVRTSGNGGWLNRKYKWLGLLLCRHYRQNRDAPILLFPELGRYRYFNFWYLPITILVFSLHLYFIFLFFIYWVEIPN